MVNQTAYLKPAAYASSESLESGRQEPGSLRTLGEIEAGAAREFGGFELEFMGRGPTNVQAHLLGDLLVVRMTGVLTAAEKHLTTSHPPATGRNLIKQVRTHLIETARPRIAALVEAVTGVNLVSLHYDISTVTGEEVLVISLSEVPQHRKVKSH